MPYLTSRSHPAPAEHVRSSREAVAAPVLAARGFAAPNLSARVRAAPVLVALVALVLAACASAQTTAENLDLGGPVAHLEEYRWYPGTTERQLFQTFAIDEDGQAIERVYYAYSFRDGSLRSRYVTTYDAGRRLATVVLDVDDEPIGQTVYRYDDEGRLTEEVTVDAEGAETRRVTYERDGAGNVVRQVDYTDGAVSRRFENVYDAEGGLIEQRSYDEEGRLYEVETYTVPDLEHDYVSYDEEGEVEATGSVVETEDGTVSWVEFGPDGEVAESYAFAYDENGLQIERRDVYGEDAADVYSYAYELDEYGSWVRRVTTENLGNGPETYEIRERVITYR